MQRQYITKIYTAFKSMIPKMSFVQNDTNVNRIQFEFYDDVNEPMTDIFDATAVIKRPDTNSYTFGSDAFEIDGNVVTLILPPAAVYLSGEYTAKVSVYDNNYGRLSTQTFTYSVTAELTSNTPIDQTNEYPVLTKLIADTQDVKNTTESNYQNALNSSASIATLEVVDARKGEANLGAKIAKIDSSLAEYAHIVNVKHEGVKGDGTDETVKVQAALDKAVTQHGVFYIPSDMTVVVDQIKVDNKSNFKIVIDGTLKRKANARCYENSGIGDVWALLRISQCTDFDIPSFHGDGNIAQNPTARPDINETQHILHLSQCDRVHLGNIVGKNPGGDVVLIGYCHDVQCDNIYGYGNNVGRQTLSIYDGERMQFANIISIGVGMELMPGGIDLEPESNPNGDPPRVIRDIQFGNVYIESAADGCFSIANNYLYTSENNSVPAVVENISVDNLTCVRPYSPINGRRHFGLEIHGANNVKINGTIRESTVNSSETPLTMVGLQVEGCKNVDLDLHIYNVLMGSELGSQMIYGAGEHAQTTRNLKLKGRIHDTVYHGIGMYVMSDCDINCDVYNVGADRSLILWGYLATLSNINFKDCKLKKTVGVVAVDMNPGTYSKIRFDGCDFTGWTLINDMFRFEPDLSIADVDLIRVNCINLNYRNSMPTEGFFVKGEYVANLSPTVQGTAGSQYIVRGWNRMQTRNGDVLNVDWVEDRALIGL